MNVFCATITPMVNEPSNDRERQLVIQHPFRTEFFIPLKAALGRRRPEMANMDPAIDFSIHHLYHFFQVAQERFNFNYEGIFTPEFIEAFADTYLESIKKSDEYWEIQKKHNHPEGLHADEKWRFRMEYVFPKLLSFFIHYQQRRGQAEGGRDYDEHIEEVETFMNNCYEFLSTSIYATGSLHDAGEDHFHTNGFIRKLGLPPEREKEFFVFFCAYLDKVLPAVNYPPFFQKMDFDGSDGKPLNLPQGADFDVYLKKHFRPADSIRALSKIPGLIPGYAKDRYRDVNWKFAHILAEPDPRVRFLKLVQYFLPKSADTASNLYSYFTHTGQNKGPESPEDKKKREDKQRQMRGMAQYVMFQGMVQTEAHLPQYVLEDAIVFPEWKSRRKLEALRLEQDPEQKLLRAFEDDLRAAVAVRYKNAHGVPFPQDKLEIKMWPRAMHHLKSEIPKILRSKKLPDATSFMHIVDIRIIDQDPESAKRLKAMVEAVMAGLVPIEKKRGLEAERAHHLVGKLCSIRTDEGVQKSESSKKYGDVVYSVRTLPEARRDFEGYITSIYLNQDKAAFVKMNGLLESLKGSVDHIEKQLLIVEAELEALASMDIQIVQDATRKQLSYFTPVEKPLSRMGVFGKPLTEGDDLAAYAKNILMLYYDLKEQVLTHMLPRDTLEKFSVKINGQPTRVADSSLTIPRGSNPLYALFYLFPFDAQKRIKRIKVYRRETNSNVVGNVDTLRHLTLRKGDAVEIELYPDQDDSRALKEVRDFARENLYPEDDAGSTV